MRPARLDRSYLAALLVVAAGCNVGPPNVVGPGNGDGSVGSSWADSVISYVQSGNANNCSAGLPDCQTTFVQTGCAADAAVGPMDGVSWTLEQGDNIVLGFRCSTITEVGIGTGDLGFMHSPDFQIFGTSTQPLHTVVEVSVDDSSWYTVNMWGQLGSTTDPVFDLMYTTQASTMPMPLELARYVRITQAGSGSAQIDAVESLRAIK